LNYNKNNILKFNLKKISDSRHLILSVFFLKLYAEAGQLTRQAQLRQPGWPDRF
jgi:hypothetical protein